MKKVIYLCALIIIVCASKTEAQYYITSTHWVPYIDSGMGSYCTPPVVVVNTNAYTTGLSIKIYYGDGTSNVSTVLSGGSYGYVNFNSNYSFPGTYTLKYVLYIGTIPIDSVISTGRNDVSKPLFYTKKCQLFLCGLLNRSCQYG